MKTFFIFLALCISVHAADKAVVYDLTTANLANFKQKIHSMSLNSTHYANNLETLRIAVVVHGDAYKFFLKTLKNTEYAQSKDVQSERLDIHKRLKALYEFNHVEFLICGSGVKHHKISPANIYSFVKIDPNASISLINKQSQGYAYIPVH